MTKLELKLLSESLDNPKVTKTYIEKVIRNLHFELSKNARELELVVQLEILRVITKALTLKNIVNNLPNHIINEYIFKEGDTSRPQRNSTVDILFSNSLNNKISGKDLNYYFKYVDKIYINFRHTTVRYLKETTVFKLINTFLHTSTHLKFIIKSPNTPFYNSIPISQNNGLLYITIHSILYQLNHKKSIITDQLLKTLPVENSEILQKETQDYKLQLTSMKYAVTQFEKEINELSTN